MSFEVRLRTGSGLGSPVASTNPLPITIVDATTPMATEASLLALDASVDAIYTRLGNGSAHVIIDSMPAGGASLTDLELRASPVPVVDAAGNIVLATLATSALQTTGNTSLSSINGKLPALVSGRVPVDGSGVTQPVSGTFWQATQPISAASLPLPTSASQEHATAVSPNASRLSDGAAFYDATKTGQLPSALVGGRLDENIGAWLGSTAPTVGSKTSANSVPVVIASDQAAVPVTAPTLTKGTQGANGFSVQNLRDAGRVLYAASASAIATVTTEALITLTPYRDLTAGGGATTFAVTANKKLRLQSIVVTIRCTGTVNVGGIVRFRMLAGTVLVASPVVASVGGMGSNLATAVIGNAQSYPIEIPDGFELSGTMQFGLTQLFSATTATIDVHVLGYEY